MANFLPSVLEIEGFTVEASVQHGKKRVDRRFKITPKDPLRPLRKTPRAWVPDEIATFREPFEKLDSGWELSEAVELIDGPEGVLIPDFAFRHRETGIKVWMEVVGYWRRAPVAASAPGRRARRRAAR